MVQEQDMNRALSDFESLRYAPFYNNSSFISTGWNCTCKIRHLASKAISVHFISHEYSINIQLKEHWIVIIEPEGLFKVPYNCEDQNEFFQLSTMYDYRGLTYQSLVKLKELELFMKNRDINERVN